MALLAGPTNSTLAQCGSEQKLGGRNPAAYDFFGSSVAMSHDALIVGVPGADRTPCALWGNSWQGSAVVYRFDGTSWVEEQELWASDGRPYDIFGICLDVDGDLALGGAYGADDQRGACYLFRYDGTYWVEEQKLTASDGAAYDDYGCSVALSGDVAVIGAQYGFGALRESGVAYVYRFDGTDWVEEQKLMPADGERYDRFGDAVSLDGDVAVIGAYGAGPPGSGAAYVYRYDGTEWVLEQRLPPSDGRVAGHFGMAVAVRDGLAVIGAPYEDSPAGEDAGSAYVYRFDGAEWVEERKLAASDAIQNQHFGRSISLFDDLILVGAPGNGYTGNGYIGAPQRGSAYLFELDTTGEAKFRASDSGPGDAFGSYVSLWGEWIAVGASGDDAGGEDSGSAYVHGVDGLPR
jgi:hypothetical protein